jgi:hypothetical protein
MMMMLTFDFWHNTISARPVVRWFSFLCTYSRVKKSFWLPHSLTVVDTRVAPMACSRLQMIALKERGPSFPSNSTFALRPTTQFSSHQILTVHYIKHNTHQHTSETLQNGN